MRLGPLDCPVDQLSLDENFARGSSRRRIIRRISGSCVLPFSRAPAFSLVGVLRRDDFSPSPLLLRSVLLLGLVGCALAHSAGQARPAQPPTRASPPKGGWKLGSDASRSPISSEGYPLLGNAENGFLRSCSSPSSPVTTSPTFRRTNRPGTAARPAAGFPGILARRAGHSGRVAGQHRLRFSGKSQPAFPKILSLLLLPGRIGRPRRRAPDRESAPRTGGLGQEEAGRRVSPRDRRLDCAAAMGPSPISVNAFFVHNQLVPARPWPGSSRRPRSGRTRSVHRRRWTN